MNFLTVYLEQFLQGTWAQNVGWTLLHSLWQITLIAALYAVAAVGLRKRSASLRYLVGCVAMAAMVIMPVATFYVLPSPVESVAVEIVESTTVQSSDPIEPLLIADQQEQFESALPVTQPVFDSGFGSQPSNVVFVVEQPSFLERVTLFVQPWLPTATVAWLLGVLLLSLRPLLGCLRVQTLRKSGLTPLAESHCQLAKQLVKRLGIRHVVQFAQSALVEVPTVIGYLKPMVLLPASSVTGLTAAELELILAHELAHIRRHDYALNLIQTVIEALLFYHPGMWWVSSHVRHERENCCDDVAVDISGDRATYIRALAQLEEHRVAPPALNASGSSLLMRVRRLLGEPQQEFGYRKSSLWLTTLITAGIVISVATLVGSPANEAEASNKSLASAEVTNESSDEEDTLLNFDKLVATNVANVIRQANLPFVDEQRLVDIEADFTKFISAEIPSGTYAVGASIPAKQRQAILSAIETYGARHLRLNQFQQGDLRSINLAYLGLPNHLLTLKWKLSQAIVHARTLDAGKQAKLAAQRSWMKQHIRALPQYRTFTHEMALVGLEERLRDPLCVTLGDPMTDEQFALFQQQLQKYISQKSELGHVVSHIVQASLNAQYRDFGDFDLPFNDRVVSYGAGRFVHLGFASNRSFVSTLKSVHDIEDSWTVVDAKTGSLLSIPEGNRTDGKLQPWLSEKGQGDFGFDDAQGGGLFAVRGAKLVKLDVTTWVEADAIRNDDLRALLNSPAAGPVVSLEEHYEALRDYEQADPTIRVPVPYSYVSILTKEGQLAVVAVEDFSGRSSVHLRTRVRPGLPKMVTETLSDDEVTLFFDRPAHWVKRKIEIKENDAPFRICGYDQPTSEADGTIPMIKAEFQDYGHPYSVDITTKQNPAATVNKVLTVAGEPARLISFKIQGLSDQNQAPRELMHLLFGKGTRGYDLAFIYPTSQRQQYVELALAVGKSIRVRTTVDETENSSRNWGEPINGLRLGTNIPANHIWTSSAKLNYELWIKNDSNKPLVVTDYPSIDWNPNLIHLIDKDGNRVHLSGRPVETGPVQIRTRNLAAGEVVVIGQYSINLPSDLRPGQYTCSLLYHVEREEKAELLKSPAFQVNVGLENGSAGVLPKGLELLAGIPEFAELRIDMSEEQFFEIIAKHDLDVQSTRNNGENTSSHWLRTTSGKTVVVMFADGKCRGIQRMRDQLALGEAIGGVRIALSQKSSLAWTPEQPPKLVANVMQQGPEVLLLSTVQTPANRLKVDGVLYRHPGENLIGVVYQPSSLRIDRSDGIGPPIDLDTKWRSVKDDRPLRLKPGQHRISYGWSGFHPSTDAPSKPDKNQPVLLWTGEIEVEIAESREMENSYDWGDATDGVQMRIHSAEVRQDQGQRKVLCKTDIRANKNRIMPHYGAPIGEYVIQWDGKWYRRGNDIASFAANMLPSKSLGRDSMHTMISANGWVEESTGQPMPVLSAGKHTLRIALPLIKSPEIEAKKPLRAVSNEIKIEVPATEEDSAAWGEAANGLQAGLVVANGSELHRIGQDVPLKFLVRNISDTPITFTHEREPAFINWDNYRSLPGTQLFGPEGQVFPASGVGGRGVPGEIKRTIPPRQTISMATVRMPLRPEGWEGTTVNLLTYCVKPGKHQAVLAYAINGNIVTSGRLPLAVSDSDQPKFPLGKPWGESRDGIRCRLQTNQTTLRPGESPVLLVDIQNQGNRAIQEQWHGLEFKLEIDGEWTGRLSPNEVSGPVAPLKPGQEWINIPLVLKDGRYWMSKTTTSSGGEVAFTKLLGPGKHKLRVDIDGVISNPIEIEITTALPNHTLSIKGEHAQSGTISGKVEGDFGPYIVLLEHENWKDRLGRLPNLLVQSGETFEFTHVPLGECTLVAKPPLVINVGKHLQQTVTTTVEVKDGQTVTANLLAEGKWDEQEKPARMTGTKTTTLPDVDRRDINTVLDLGSGEFIQNFGRSGDFSKFAEIDKGDLWQDGPNAIGTVRGGKIVFADRRKPLRAEQQSRAYALPDLPCQLVVITAEGRSFDVKVTSKETDGLKIKYFEKAMPRISIDPWEDMEEWLAARAVEQLALQGIERIARGSGDPDLRIARLYDAELNGGIYLPDGQAVTEAFYLRYLPRSKTSAERCEIYTQLSVLFSTNIGKKFGGVKDLPKAREYARKAVEEEPNRIGSAIIRARMRSFGSDMSKDEIFEKRLAVYKWLTSWTEKSIRENWMPRRYEVGREDHYFPSFLRRWKGVAETQANNLLGVGSQDPEKLRKIIEVVPETEAAERATKQLVALQAADELESQVGDPFVGLYRGTLGERDVTWRILKQNGSYYFKENPDSKTTPEHQKFKLVDGSLVGEDPAERFRFTTDQASGGLIFEMWNKKSGESYGRIALKRIDESTFTTSGRESNEGTPKTIERTWGPEVEGFQTSLSADSTPWIAGEASPLFHAKVQYQGEARTGSTSMDSFIIELDDKRFLLSSIATGFIKKLNFFQASRNNEPTDYNFFFRLTTNPKGVVVHQCRPDGAHLRTLAMSGLRKTEVRFGSLDTSLKPDVSTGEHQIRVGFPVWATEPRVKDAEANSDWAFAFSPAITTEIQGKDGRASGTSQSRTIKVPKWPRIPSPGQPHAFSGFGTFEIRDDELLGQPLIAWTELKPVGGQLVVPLGKALGIAIDSGNYTDLSALKAFAPDGLQSVSLPLQNKIDDRAMPNLGQLTGLKRLLLGGSAITDKGLPHLTKLKELKYLSLQSCPITDQSIQTLRQIASLNEINLWHTWVTKRGAERLQQALPGCRVKWLEATDRIHPKLATPKKAFNAGPDLVVTRPLSKTAQDFQTQQQQDLKVTLIGVYSTTKIKIDADEKTTPQPGVLVRYLVQQPMSSMGGFGVERLFDGDRQLIGIPGGSSTIWPYEWVKDQPGVTLPELDSNLKTKVTVREVFIRGIKIPDSKIRLLIRCEKDKQQFDFAFPDVAVGETTDSWNQLFESSANNARAAEAKKQSLTWGPETPDGFQLGIEFTNVPPKRTWHAGSTLNYKLWIRNTSDIPQLATDSFPLRGYHPEILNEQGEETSYPLRNSGGLTRIRERLLAPGEILEIGTISEQLSSDLKPGRYTCKQIYGITSDSKDNLHMSVSAKFNVAQNEETAQGETDAPKSTETLNLIDANKTLRWDRLKPNNEHARVLREWDSTPYEKARSIGINKSSELPELWEAVPPGSGSYEIRKDVHGVMATWDTTIFHRRDLNRFWVQRDPPASSFMTYFGPFEGDPFEVLGIQAKKPKDHSVEKPATKDNVIWGPINEGLQIGVELPDARTMANWRPGSKVAYKLWIKASGRPKPVTDAIPVRGWYPEFRDKDGKLVFQWMPPNDGPVQIRERTLTADGGPVEVGRIEFELPKDIKPGRYSLKQPYRVTSGSQDLLPMEVAFEIEVGAPADHTFHVGGEPKQAGVIRGKVVGDSGPYLVTIEHDVWRNNTGLLPNLVVKSGETFEFMNVPIGRYEIVAKATLVINEGKHQVQTLSQEIAVDDVEPVEVLLVDSRTARLQFRMEMPQNSKPLPGNADRVTLTDNDGQKETLTLYKQIYLDEDDVQIAWMRIEGMQPRLDLTFTDESAPKLKAITTPAIKDGRRLVVLLDEEVIAAVTIKSPLDKTVSLTGLTYERAKQLHEKVQTTLTRTLPSNSDEEELHRTAIEGAKRGANDLQDAQGKAAFAEYSRVSKAFSEGADHLESGIQFGQIVKQTPANWHSRRRVHELAELLVEMSQQQEPAIKDDVSLDARIDRLVWRLRDLAEPAMMTPGKVRVLAFNKDEKKNPAYALLLLAKKPKNRNYAVGRLIAMLDDRRPTRSWATPLNGGHFYRNADVALEILDHLAFKERRALEDLNFYSGSGRDAYFTTADEKTRREVVTRVKGWWKEQLGTQTGETPTEAQPSPSTTSELIISKERGGQFSPGGIGYSLDNELITLDKLQSRLQKKLKESPELKLLISADPELTYQTVAVVIQLAKAAGVKKISFAAAGEKSPPLTPGASSIKLHQDGTVSCIIEVSAGKPLQVCFDRRDLPAIEKSSWKVAGNMTQGRLFAGADHPDKPAARLVKLHSEEEKQILRGLNQWFDSLNDEQKREKKLQNLLREVQQFERVFVDSGGVDIQLQKQFQPQANPNPVPPLLISAVNRGELESLTLGRTDQAFELEVDGDWYCQTRVSFKSSPLPPGRLYDPFPLVLDERWQQKQSLKPLQLKPGMHAVRVRRVMHPFPSNAKSVTATSDKIQIQVLRARRKMNDEGSSSSSIETVKPSSRIEVTDVVTYLDGGTTSFKLQRPGDKAVQIGFDYRDIQPEEVASVFKFVGNKTLGRIYVGAEQPDHASARFIQPGGEEDTRLVKELNDWLDQELSADIQTQMLTTPRNSRFYKRLISSTGKTADELKQRESILQRVRWYEHVYLQSQGVHLLLSGDTEKQWNPKEPPTFQITATNYRFPNAPIGDNRTELELGRTHQAFELEVDGQWYRMGIVRFRASPFSPGQIFEDIALPLDGRWLRDGRKFKLSPGKHTFRVRTTFDRLKGVQADEPFTATSNAITCWVAPKEDAEDSESTTQTQAPQKQALLDLEKACRTHLRTMPQSYRISAEARSIDHTRLQLIDSQILTDSAIALLAVGGPEQVAPGSSEKSNELLWCCQLKRIANQDGDARWEVMDTQTVASAIAYRKLESHFYRDHPTFPPGSAKSRKAVVVGAPDGSGLAAVTVKAFVSQQKEPVLDTQTDAEGYFLLPNSPPSEELTGGLSSTRRGYRLQISKPGYLPSKQHWFVTLDREGNYGRQAFLMRKSTTVAGKLLGVNGKPMTGAQVRLQTITDAPDQRLEQGYEIKTNAEGRFRFDGVWPGKHLVQFCQAIDDAKITATKGRTTAAIVETSDTVEGSLFAGDVLLDLSKSTAQLAVTLLDEAGHPVPNQEVHIVWHPLLGRWGGGSYSRSLHYGSYPKVITDANGQATFTGLPVGKWAVRVENLHENRWRVAEERLTFRDGVELETTLRFLERWPGLHGRANTW